MVVALHTEALVLNLIKAIQNVLKQHLINKETCSIEMDI
jgi:hypothetical protein